MENLTTFDIATQDINISVLYKYTQQIDQIYVWVFHNISTKLETFWKALTSVSSEIDKINFTCHNKYTYIVIIWLYIQNNWKQDEDIMARFPCNLSILQP